VKEHVSKHEIDEWVAEDFFHGQKILLDGFSENSTEFWNDILKLKMKMLAKKEFKEENYWKLWGHGPSRIMWQNGLNADFWS